ncbi:MAG: hypothetical protein HN472_16670 [Nitrospina sp.]|jgi:hypothetical protein|nr:hypothetical protein [Nitrospina sp.]MBT3511162.1 hypothetical protein [Nitrospina sp.]MBT3876057.1 hypothetical protein [Nitrospina sp.]MBT4048365.1 hypothetical protein [Nitrospina sp.]MBT4556493.1 hypothetical protein [Nitrospina sp.]
MKASNLEGMTMKVSRLSYLFLVLFLFSNIGIAVAGDAVPFSGVVKKVIADKNKVGIKDPKTKKRFTVIVNEKTQPDGLKTLASLKKKDNVAGKYTVTGAGLYIALELVKK